jgi:hypothetical protein
VLTFRSRNSGVLVTDTDQRMSKDTTPSRFAEFATSFIRRRKADAIAPRLENPKRKKDGRFHFQLLLVPQTEYEVHGSTDFKTWEPLCQNKTSVAEVEFMDNDAEEIPFRFYRAVSGGLPSTNIVGYVSAKITPGFTLISNPLISPSTVIPMLFTDIPSGTVINKFDSTRFRMVEVLYSDGKWDPPTEKLLPGEGAIISNPTQEHGSVSFVGNVALGHVSRPMPPGMSVRSSLVPIAGRLDKDLNFPVHEGDKFHIWDKSSQQYVEYIYPSKEWDAKPPVIGVGEAFWVAKTTAGTWAQEIVLS